MTDLQPLGQGTPPTLVERVRATLAPVTSTLVPGALVGAVWLTGAEHWQAAKAALVAHGVPVSMAIMAAPMVGISALLGLRYLWRMMRPDRDDDTP